MLMIQTLCMGIFIDPDKSEINNNNNISNMIFLIHRTQTFKSFNLFSADSLPRPYHATPLAAGVRTVLYTQEGTNWQATNLRQRDYKSDIVMIYKLKLRFDGIPVKRCGAMPECLNRTQAASINFVVYQGKEELLHGEEHLFQVQLYKRFRFVGFFLIEDHTPTHISIKVSTTLNESKSSISVGIPLDPGTSAWESIWQ